MGLRSLHKPIGETREGKEEKKYYLCELCRESISVMQHAVCDQEEKTDAHPQGNGNINLFLKFISGGSSCLGNGRRGDSLLLTLIAGVWWRAFVDDAN